MKCMNCNKEIEENDNFCPYCGAKVQKMIVHNIEELTKQVEKNQKIENNIKKNYKLPPIDLLESVNQTKKTNIKEIESKEENLNQTLEAFKINAKVKEIIIGPNFTTYSLELERGVRVKKIIDIKSEIEVALGAKILKIEPAVLGKNYLGIIIENINKNKVTLKELLETESLEEKNNFLQIPFGKDIFGINKSYKINELKSIFINGISGSGKSVCINDIIISILMKARPDEVKLVLVDPKKVELGIYNGIPHLLTPVVTDPRKASIALKKAVAEMERRYDVFEENKTKNIESYNELVEKKNQKLPGDEKLAKMPYIVVIVDELADLMLVAGKEVEDSLIRITEYGQQVGIYLIITSQASKKDLRIDKVSFRTNIEFIQKEGEMLVSETEKEPDRIQGAFVSEEEIQKVIDFTVSQQKTLYESNFNDLEAVDQDIKQNNISHNKEEYDDPLYNDIVEFVIETQKVSASLFQRRFKIGYNRAARIVELLEERGIIGPQNGSKPREVLVKPKEKEE